MRFEQTRDILNHAREFHRQVSQLYKRLSDKAEKKRVRMLLDYMSRHESNLEKSMARFQEQTSKEVLDTWFSYTHDEDTLALCRNTELEPGMTVDEVVRAALRLDDCLTKLYREVAECTDCNEVREIFKNLLALEEKEKSKLARNAQLLLDV